MKLQKLEINAFRGATKPVSIEFNSSKKITMIFGENGNGKSTISDAIVALCTPNLGSITDKSSVDKSYIAAVGCAPEDLSIKLTTDQDVFEARKSPTASVLVKAPLDGLPPVRFLRRSQIVGLIDTEPSKRYVALKEYIDVSNIIKSEEGLRKLHRNTNAEQEAIIRTLESAKATLESIWDKEGKPNTSYMDWASNEVTKDVSDETAKFSISNGIVAARNALAQPWERLREQERKVVSAEEKTKQLKKSLAELEEQQASVKADLVHILNESKRYLTNNADTEKCPMCKNDIDREDLIKKIDEELTSMNVLNKLVSDIKNAESNESSQKAILERSKEDLNRLITTFMQKVEEGGFLGEVAALASLKSTESLDDRQTIFNQHGAEIKAFATSQLELAQSTKRAIEQHNHIKEQYDSIVRDTNKAESTQTLLKAIEKALNLAEQARKDFLEQELLSVSSDIESLYQKIHPDEGLGGIRLFLKENFKNSLALVSKFHGLEELTPQSVYSESHLDTLGICIFLALAKKYCGEDTILVLDDVVMSVDEKHLDRFIDVLHDEVGQFAHVLITTHYRPWRDRYRHHRAPNSQVHFVELKKWTIERGIRLQNGLTSIQELKEALEATDMDRQRIANLAGTTLENVLDFITLKFRSKLPRKPANDYTLSDLLNGISSKLSKVLKVQHLGKGEDEKYTDSIMDKEEMLKPRLDALKQLTAVRNQVGAHFSFAGSLVSDQDVRTFGEKVLEFAELLTCPDSGAFPDRNKSGSYYESRSGSIRLFPLTEPTN